MELPILEEDLAVKLRRSQRRNQATRMQASKIGCCLKKTAEQKEINLNGELHECRGVQWRRGYGSPSPDLCTPAHIPFDPAAPPQQLSPFAEEG